MLRAVPVAVCALALLAACGSDSSRTGVATNPPDGGGATQPPATATPAASGVRTVLSPLGLNIHAQPALTAAVVGTPAQGATLAVLDHTGQNGGWYEVQGATVTGWITADPALSAPGSFQQYQSSDFGFNVLYPQDWTFDASTAAVTFRPQSGPQTIEVRDGASVAAFERGAPGYFQASQQTVVVCGVTADLNGYARAAGSTASATPASAATSLPLLAQIHLRLDSSHALAVDFSYVSASDLDVFSAFYNSLTFPFPQCMQASAATPTP